MKIESTFCNECRFCLFVRDNTNAVYVDVIVVAVAVAIFASSFKHKEVTMCVQYWYGACAFQFNV